jgi:hypothetical protein
VGQLRKLGAEVVEKEFDPQRWCAAMTWRFLTEDDAEVTFWASRESESPPTFQDSSILQHWTQYTKDSLHVIHVLGPHQTWNGGLFGGRRGYLSRAINSSMEDAIKRFQDKIDASGRKYGSKYNDDQFFMAGMWNAAKMHENAILYFSDKVNRTPCTFERCQHYPDYPGKPDGFRASMNPITETDALLCHHHEKPFCRYHRHKNEQVWRGLYELCVGEDFFTGDPKHEEQLGFKECPYKNVRALDTWKRSGATLDSEPG